MRQIGFTLLELIIYLAIIAGLLLSAVGVYWNLSNLQAKAECQIELEYSVGFVDNILSQAIYSSRGLDYANSIVNNDAGKLALLSTSTIFSVDNEILSVNLGAGVPEIMTPEAVKVKRFRVGALSQGAISVNMDLFAGQNSGDVFHRCQKSVNFVYAPRVNN